MSTKLAIALGVLAAPRRPASCGCGVTCQRGVQDGLFREARVL